MLKRLIAGLLAFGGLLVVACSSDASGSDLCARFETICPGGKSGDGGVTLTVKCDSAKLDTASNKDEVKSCLDSANDCSTGTQCLLKAKQ
jgi:hypothetical protein